MQKNNLIKRYFLSTAPAPFLTGFLFGIVPAVIAACGWMVVLFVMDVLGRLDLLGPSADPWFLGSVFGITGLGVVLGAISSHVCRRFVNYDRGSGLYFLVKDGKVVLDEEGKVTRFSRRDPTPSILFFSSLIIQFIELLEFNL